MLKISIIIPVYNVETSIERCARSLYEQTYPHIEYIWVNDATPDTSMGILKGVTDEYPQRKADVRIVEHSCNRGLPTARNTGLSMATGDYVYHCDSDDWADVDMIEELVIQAEFEKADIVWCDFYKSYRDKEVLVKQDFVAFPMQCISNLLSERMHGGYWNKLIRRSLYTENNIEFSAQANMCEDLRGSIQLFYYAKRVAYYPESFYHYVQSSGHSLSADFSPDKLDSILVNIDGIIRFLQDKGDEGIFKEEINYLKLLGKRSLLITTDKSRFIQWRSIYPEANGYILSYAALPVSLRLVGWCAYRQWWFGVSVWIGLKKIKNKIFG